MLLLFFKSGSQAGYRSYVGLWYGGAGGITSAGVSVRACCSFQVVVGVGVY